MKMFKLTAKFIVALCVLLWSNLSWAELKVEEHTTPAGVTFWYHHMPEADYTAIKIEWLVNPLYGSTTDPLISNFGAMVMRQAGIDGDGAMSADDLAETLTDMDVGLDLYSTTGSTVGLFAGPPEELLTGAELVGRVLANPTFELQTIDRSRTTYIDNVTRRRSGTWGATWDLVIDILAQDHPYNHYLRPRNFERFNEFNQGDLVAWHGRIFTRDRVLVGAAGSSPVGDVAMAIDTALSGLPISTAEPYAELPRVDVFNFEAQAGRGSILLHRPESEKTSLIALVPMPGEDEGVNVPLNFAVGVFGVSSQSRLFKAMRSELRASYGFSAWFETWSTKTRFMRMSGEVETAQLAEAVKVLGETYETYRESGMGFLEHPIARRYYKRRLDEIFVSEAEMANLLLFAQGNGNDMEHVALMGENAADTSRSQINSMIKEHFPPWDQALVIAVSPDADALPGACVITKVEDWHTCR